jgi:hypothetical protein
MLQEFDKLSLLWFFSPFVTSWSTPHSQKRAESPRLEQKVEEGSWMCDSALIIDRLITSINEFKSVGGIMISTNYQIENEIRKE